MKFLPSSPPSFSTAFAVVCIQGLARFPRFGRVHLIRYFALPPRVSTGFSHRDGSPNLHSVESGAHSVPTKQHLNAEPAPDSFRGSTGQVLGIATSGDFRIGENCSMRKILVLSSIALLYASLGWAQDSSAQSSTSTASSSSANSGAIQGCLNGSDGNYTLTQDSTGTVFKLVGNADVLKEHVGHEVAVTGQMAGDPSSSTSAPDQQASPSSGSADTNTSGTSTLQVSDVKMISRHCGSESNAPQAR